MEIREDRRDGVLVIAPSGRFDTNTSGELERRLLDHLAAGERRLVIDLVGVEYVSSAGLRVLLLLAKKLRESAGALVLCSMTRSVQQVFALAGFDTIFEVEPSREAALARLARRG